MERIALIAHDEKKEDLVRFVLRHKAKLEKYRLVATNTTGTSIEREAGLEIQKMLSGPLGGDMQIGAMVAEAKIKAVFFLRDPLTAHAHEPDIAALMKVCDTHNVPLATNVASAEMILAAL
jgi:methylglyoxal synthase